jgi:hypothetical protein
MKPKQLVADAEKQTLPPVRRRDEPVKYRKITSAYSNEDVIRLIDRGWKVSHALMERKQ